MSYDDRPPFIGPQVTWVECWICGQVIEDLSRIEGVDISTKDEYYPQMKPVCPTHEVDSDGVDRGEGIRTDGGTQRTPTRRHDHDDAPDCADCETDVFVYRPEGRCTGWRCAFCGWCSWLQRDRRLVADGGLPESITELAGGGDVRDQSACRACGDLVERRYLVDRRCVGCRERGDHDGRSASIATNGRLVTDGGRGTLHFADGYLSIPEEIDASKGLVIRARGVTIDHKPGSLDLDEYPLQECHLEADEPVRNDHLEMYEVSLKSYGEEPRRYDVQVLEADGGVATDRYAVSGADGIVYGPAFDSEGYVLLVATEERRVEIELDEDAMYTLWTEVKGVPWPEPDEMARKDRLVRQVLHAANGADEESLREALGVLGGERR